MIKNLSINDTLIKVFKNTFLVQLIGVLIIPFIYFNFDQKDFSDYGLFFSISAISSIFISLRLENLFFSLREYKNLFIFSIVLVLFITCTSVFIVFIIFDNLLYILCIFGGASIASFNLLYNFLVRENLVGVYTKLKLFRVLLEFLAVSVVCFFQLKINILILFTALSYFLIFITVFFIYLKFKCDLSGLIKGFISFRENIRYIWYDFFASILNALYIYMPTIYFYLIGNSLDSGNYFLILRVFGVPTIMIGQSISTVVRQFSSREFQKSGKINETYIYFKNIFMRYYYLIIVFLLISFFVFYLVDLFYIPGIFYYSIVIIILMIVRALYNSISSVIYVFSMQLVNFIFQILLTLFSFLFLFMSFFNINPIHLYSLTSIFLYMAFMYYIFFQAVNKGYIEK